MRTPAEQFVFDRGLADLINERDRLAERVSELEKDAMRARQHNHNLAGKIGPNKRRLDDMLKALLSVKTEFEPGRNNETVAEYNRLRNVLLSAAGLANEALEELK